VQDGIQEVAKITDLSSYTLRYYEKIELVREIERNIAGYRQYLRSDIAWIKFIIRLRLTGMPIIQMKKFSDLRQEGDSSIAARKEMLIEHYREVMRKLEELKVASSADLQS
jgi:DNA-binding transcriptional MerR regulator